MEYEILPPPENYLPANDSDLRVLSQAQRKQRDGYDERLDDCVEMELHNDAQKGNKSDLEMLLNDAPTYLHAELRHRFAQKLNAARRDLMLSDDMSEAQKTLLQRLKKAEATMDLPKQVIRQMRALVMRNPQLLNAMIALANVLLRHGVTGIAKVASADIDAPNATPASATPASAAAPAKETASR